MEGNESFQKTGKKVRTRQSLQKLIIRGVMAIRRAYMQGYKKRLNSVPLIRNGLEFNLQVLIEETNGSPQITSIFILHIE